MLIGVGLFLIVFFGLCVVLNLKFNRNRMPSNHPVMKFYGGATLIGVGMVVVKMSLDVAIKLRGLL